MSSGFSQRFCSSSAAPRHQGLVTIEGCLSSGGCGIFMKATKPHVLRILKVKHGKTLKSELNLKALGLAKWLRVVLLSKGTARSQANTHQRPGGSSKTMPCLPSPSHHHFYRWYVYHSQSWLVFDFLFYPHTTLLYISYTLKTVHIVCFATCSTDFFKAMAIWTWTFWGCNCFDKQSDSQSANRR